MESKKKKEMIATVILSGLIMVSSASAMPVLFGYSQYLSDMIKYLDTLLPMKTWTLGGLNVTGKTNLGLSHLMGYVTQIHTVPVADTWYNLTFNDTLGDSENMLFIDNHTIKIEHDGHYTINIGMGIIDSAANPTSNVAMRVVVNGQELDGSYAEMNPFKQYSEMWFEHAFHTKLKKGDRLNMQYISSKTSVTIEQHNTFTTKTYHAYGLIEEII